MGQRLARRTRWAKTRIDDLIPIAQTAAIDIASLQATTETINEKITTGAAVTPETIGFNGGSPATTDLVLPAAGYVGATSPLRLPAATLQSWFRWVRERIPGAAPVATTLCWVPTITGGSPDDGGFWTTATPTTSYSTYAPYVLQETNHNRLVMLDMPRLVPGIHIKQITARVASPVSHGGTKPTNMPILGLMKSFTVSSLVTVGSQTDSSATAGAYEAEHDITLIIDEPVASGYTYSIFCGGENGGTAQNASFRIYSLKMVLWYA